MKTFLTRLKRSLALDRPRQQTSRAGAATDLFAALERRLREKPTTGIAPANLHSSIMSAVRAQRGEISDATQPGPWRWAAVAGTCLVLALGGWWILPPVTSRGARVSETELQPLIAVALNQGRNLTEKAPDVALSPLVGEMELLNRDFQSAVNLVVATMP